jgi:O-antigen ligase
VKRARARPSRSEPTRIRRSVSLRSAYHSQAVDKVLVDSGNPTASVPLDAPAPASRDPWAKLRDGLPRREAVVLVLVAAATGGAAAAAGALPVTAAVLFVAGVCIGFGRPSLVAPFLALLLPIGFSLTSVHGVQISLLHAAVVGSGGGYALRLYRRGRRPQLEAPDIAFGAFLAGVTLSGVGPVAKPVWLHELALWGGLALVFHCTVRALAQHRARQTLYLALAATGLFEAIYAIAQYATNPSLVSLGGTAAYLRPEATLQHPNSLGGFLVLVALVLLGAALAEQRRVRSLGLALVVVIVLGTATTFSRGAWISFGAGVVALIVAGRRHRRLLGGAGAGLAIVATTVALLDLGPLGRRLSSLLNSDALSLYGFRATLVHRALDVIAHHPLTGAGAFHVQGVYAGAPTAVAHPHDMLLGVGVFFGIPAATAFTVLLAIAVRAAWRASRSHDVPLAAEGVGAFAALVALLVNGLFEYQFWNNGLTVEIALLLVLAVAIGRAPRAPTASGPDASAVPAALAHIGLSSGTAPASIDSRWE